MSCLELPSKGATADPRQRGLWISKVRPAPLPINIEQRCTRGAVLYITDNGKKGQVLRGQKGAASWISAAVTHLWHSYISLQPLEIVLELTPIPNMRCKHVGSLGCMVQMPTNRPVA